MAQSMFPAPSPNVPLAAPESLNPQARAAFQRSGWPSLMPVQAQAIPHLAAGDDLIVQSRTGSGKTGAFLLPMFDTIDRQQNATQVLILTPTRELAIQIHDEFERIKPPSANLRAALVYGGVGYSRQIAALRRGVHMVVGTPGRILDLLRQNHFKLSELRTLILDEADEMLSMGFYPAMVAIKDFLPSARQSCMFSATMPPKVRMLGRQFLRDACFLGLSKDGVSVDTIDHRYYRVESMDRERALARLLEVENPDSAIVFANTRSDVAFLSEFLRNYGFSVDVISGQFSQREREAAMRRLRNGTIRILVATDVAARGIDISELSHVFQYGTPVDDEAYVHRTGRTARAGRAGVAITLVTVEDEQRLVAIARRFGIQMEKRTLPDNEEAATRVAQRMLVILEEKMRIKSKLERERLKRFVPMVESWARGEPELMAMLVDELYHAHMDVSADQSGQQELAQEDRVQDGRSKNDRSEPALEPSSRPEKRRRKKRR